MSESRILVITDDADFARTLVNRWRMERSFPVFTVMGSGVWLDAEGEYDAAIVAPLPMPRLLPVLAKFEEVSATRPAICVCSDTASVQHVREKFPRLLTLRSYEGWAEAVVLLGSELLRRIEAVARLNRAEEMAAASRRNAALGRYILETRHSLNNALTSVLGNAELLLLEPDGLGAEVREQIHTIHSMALRMHEILQRFSSLDTEMQFAEKQSHSETVGRAQGHAAGS
jgi:signal transduction histidine kinase